MLIEDVLVLYNDLILHIYVSLHEILVDINLHYYIL